MNPELEARLDSLISEHGLDAYRRLILDAAAPAIRLETTRADDQSLPVGASKFGGLPDLPPDFPWPTYNSRTIAFLAQINLAEMPADQFEDWPLPRAGLLSFWFDTADEPWGFDPKDAGSYQVHYFPAPDALTRRPYPDFVRADLEGDPHWDWEPFKACSLATEVIITLDYQLLMDPHLPDADFEASQKLREDAEGKLPWHRLLGEPEVIQNPMEPECQLASNGIYCGGTPPKSEQQRIDALKPGAADWRLLLQIDTDDEGPDWMWGDSGSLYYWIRRQELERQDFTGVWGILQCH